MHASLQTPDLLAVDPKGFTLWLTGCPGAGKSTLASSLREALTGEGHRVEVLDGDEVRQMIGRDLGYSKKDRDTNVERLGYIARLLSRNGVAVIVAAVSPYREAREAVRRTHQAPFVEVFVDCLMSELARRDQKGLYTRAARGEITGVTGVSDPYEPPLVPDVHLHTDRMSVPDCCRIVMDVLRTRRLLSGPGVSRRQGSEKTGTAAGRQRGAL